MNLDDFYEKLAEFYPKSRYLVDEHILEYEERLDTVIFEDILFSFIEDDLMRDDSDRLKELFDFFEQVSEKADAHLMNVFQITILEKLGEYKEILSAAKKYMGVLTTKYQKEADRALGQDV